MVPQLFKKLITFKVFIFCLMWLGFFSIFFFVCVTQVSAQVVFNEIFANPSGSRSEPDEFIELMNISATAVDLTGFKIKELSGNEYVIESITLNPNSFVSFRRQDTSVILNNDKDEVFLINEQGKVLDSFSYEQTIEDRSWSRVPDGTGGFFNGTHISESQKNNPAPTSTPQPTAKPTSTPKPTKTPKPTSTSRPQNTLIPTTVSDNEVLEVLGSNTGIDLTEDFEIIENTENATNEMDQKTESTELFTQLKEDNLDGELKSNENKMNRESSLLGTGFFLLGGLGFISAAGYPIIKKRGIINVFTKSQKE